jgi:hypothetical protein
MVARTDKIEAILRMTDRLGQLEEILETVDLNLPEAPIRDRRSYWFGVRDALAFALGYTKQDLTLPPTMAKMTPDALSHRLKLKRQLVHNARPEPGSHTACLTDRGRLLLPRTLPERRQV